jgi:hypothetical protein
LASPIAQEILGFTHFSRRTVPQDYKLLAIAPTTVYTSIYTFIFINLLSDGCPTLKRVDSVDHIEELTVEGASDLVDLPMSVALIKCLRKR